MNTYAIIILVALFGAYLLELVASVLNLGALKNEIPPELEGIYEADAYARSQEYTRVGERFGNITDTFYLIVVLLFWFLGGFAWLDSFTRSFELSEIVTGLLFIGILVFAKMVISLPFTVYDTFVIEERFGFNRTTRRTFITDRIKEILLGVVLGGPILALVFWFFGTAGSYGWLYAWAAVVVISLALQYVAPTWILPIFNKFTPLEDGELRERIFAYAKSVNYPLKSLYLVDGSKRSSKANAYLTGFGENKRIALFDTLVEQQTVPELLAVVGHEVGHQKLRHIPQRIVISVFQTGLLFYLLSLFLGQAGLFEAFYVDTLSVHAGLVFFGMLYSPVEFLLSLALKALSRKHEFQADAYAAETTDGAGPLIEALKKLSRENLSNLIPHPVYAFLHYDHPPLLERVKALGS